MASLPAKTRPLAPSPFPSTTTEPREPPSIVTSLAVTSGRPEVAIVIGEAKPIEPEPSMSTCWMAERKVIVPLDVSPGPFAASSGRSLGSSTMKAESSRRGSSSMHGRSIPVPSNPVALSPTTGRSNFLEHDIPRLKLKVR